MTKHVGPEIPREQQTLRLSTSKLNSFRKWATDGSGLTAAARVRDSNGRTAFVKNRWSNGWLLPGGAVEPGESPTDAARREVREETGLKTTIEAPLVVFDQSYVDKDTREEHFSALYIVYMASGDGKIPNNSQLGVTEDEISAARWFETLPENLHDDDLLRAYL
jgi:8-oxo-dGTP diphosphatase